MKIGRFEIGWVSIASWWPLACYLKLFYGQRQFWLGKLCINWRIK